MRKTVFGISILLIVCMVACNTNSSEKNATKDNEIKNNNEYNAQKSEPSIKVEDLEQEINKIIGNNTCSIHYICDNIIAMVLSDSNDVVNVKFYDMSNKKILGEKQIKDVSCYEVDVVDGIFSLYDSKFGKIFIFNNEFKFDKEINLVDIGVIKVARRGMKNYRLNVKNKKIVYISEDNWNEIYSINYDGDCKKKIYVASENDKFDFHDAVLSDNEEYIFFVGGKENSKTCFGYINLKNNDKFVEEGEKMLLDGNNQVAFYDNLSGIDKSYKPEGKVIIFDKNDVGKKDINVVENDESTNIHFSDDEKRLYTTHEVDDENDKFSNGYIGIYNIESSKKIDEIKLSSAYINCNSWNISKDYIIFLDMFFDDENEKYDYKIRINKI